MANKQAASDKLPPGMQWMQPDDDDDIAASIVRSMLAGEDDLDECELYAKPERSQRPAAGDAKSSTLGSSSMSGKQSKKKSKSKKKKIDKTPQAKLNEYWQFSQVPKATKITSVFPRRLYKHLLPASDVLGLGLDLGQDSLSRRDSGTSSSWSTISAGAVATPTDTSSTPSTESSIPPLALGASTSNAAASYETAARQCQAAVARVVRECRRTNEKFTDQEFNLENDYRRNCLRGLVRRRTADGGDDNNEGLMPFHTPRSVHRVDWIYEKPVFTVDGGFSASDIRQGRLGDCWWIASVATIAHRTDLMERICVARDETCGVYGFVFQRDGAWVSVVVDDNLYLQREDFFVEMYDSTGQRQREHRERYQQGSKALSFARCENENETWLPLLEKAFAKVHGDYGSLTGGWSGEGVEDLTGGVSTTITTSRVLDKDRLWAELVNPEGQFVFGLSILGCGCIHGNNNGLTVNHCYSVLRAVEAEGEDGETVRLVKIRNPWGKRSEKTGFGEWHGPWSDGSPEWNAYWFKKLDHKFGDNGVFWMSYSDMLDTFGWLHRTRLFDAQWTVVQRWATVQVAWVGLGYLQTRFVIDVKKPGMVVIVLSQLDERYFRGLKGQYDYQMHFVLRSLTGDGKPDEVLSIVHASNVHELRAISCEVDIETAGRYEVLPQVKARRNRRKVTVDEVVREGAELNPDKLRQIGRQYDEAHAKGADVDDQDLALEEKRAKKLERIRAKKEWSKVQTQRAKEKKLRDEQVEWKKKREADKKEKKEKKKAERKKAKKAAKAEEEEKKKDDKNEEGNSDEAKSEEETKSEKETKSDDKDKAEKKDDSDSDVSTDEEDDFTIDIAPEPKPVPEPDFGSETDEDEDNDDLLLLREESDSDGDDDDDGDSELAKIKKRIERRSWPYDSDCEGHHSHHHGQSKKTTFREDKWNAVCVLGLRVYSQDVETTIELVKPDAKESKAQQNAVGAEEAAEAKTES
ncbi:calpain family cysteine protease [Ophiostoma piceae UAMH 11346]|uniref:Calpain family cysteine protease n=1 Tax=Ophiostoma piceae (strain UAMH 11346) TaxID=1262450 RepID=S3C735_OPHP1|nr:calpain family cysteine protease [Ophiostoma piceae UAMH 11346]